MSVLRTIDNVKSIRFRKIDDKIDMELIKKPEGTELFSRFETFPAAKYGHIYLEGKMQLDVGEGLILFDDLAACVIESSTFGPIMTCSTL